MILDDTENLHHLNSKIYIAGHSGMVGSAIMRALRSRGYNNFICKSSKELDLRRQAEVEQFFEQERPEYVFLAAAKVGGIVANNTYKAEFIYDNMAIAMNVILSAYRFRVKKLLNLGSSCIYPKFAPQPMDESALLTGILEPTNEPYAIAKIAAIKLCRYYNEQYGTNYISAMPTNLYGLNDNYNLETSHVLPALLRKMILAKALKDNDFDFIESDVLRNPLSSRLENSIEPKNIHSIFETLGAVGISPTEVTFWGSGNVRREFLHADDIASACVFLMESCNAKQIGEFVNVGTGEDISIKELALLVKKIVGYKGKLKFDIEMPDGSPRKLLNTSRIQKLGWKPSIDLRAGIKQTVQHYKSL
ncbi:MAG: GDP-L-fucose synthase [Ignavibacteria bacterium]|nr:GDP-L-fucose synthase [Ignavibacteria bacterium]